jgi:transposase
MITSQKTQENSDFFNFYSIELVDALITQNDSLTQKINELEKQNAWFKEQFKLASQRHFGQSSETAHSLNLSLFDEAMSDSQPGEESSLPKSEKITYTRKKKSVGRRIDLSRFPKHQKIYDLDEQDKTCGCGQLLEKIDDQDSSIQVDYVRESIKVIEHVSLKYCCRRCQTLRSAKKPETAIQKCMATPAFVADVVTKKYEQHLPLYRQSKILEGLGADIPDNTLGNWVMRSAEALEPLRTASKEQIPLVHLLQADETKVKTLKPNKEGYLWGYHSCDPGNRFILFDYSASRGAHVVDEMLKDFSGLLQTDGYQGYNNQRKRDGVINFGCWDHGHRKFTDIIKVSDKEKKGKAAEFLKLISRLYDIEREAKIMSPPERKIHRQTWAKPVLDHIYQEAIKINAPTKSLLNVAVTYLKNQWPYLINYLDYGEVPISNCWIENQIRPFALGRKNWMFTGTPESAQKAALLYSLIQTCKMNGINARAYLEYVLNQVNAMRRGDISPTSLLPQFVDKTIFI